MLGAAASKKNRIASDKKTVWRALLAFKVPKNIMNVKSPHMKRYAAIDRSSGARAGL